MNDFMTGATVSVGLDVHGASIRLAAVCAEELLDERTLPYDLEAVERGAGALAWTRASEQCPVEDGSAGEVELSGFGRLHADEKGYLKPLPVAVDVVKTQSAQPPELALDVDQAVGRIFVLERLADRCEERQVQSMRRRRHMLKVREHSAGFEQIEDLAIKRALPLVLQMVDGH